MTDINAGEMRQKWIELKPFSWWIVLMRDRCVQLQLQDRGFVVREVKKHVPKGPATSRQLASVKRQTGVITGFMIIFVHSKAICARLLLCLSRSQTAGGFMTDDAHSSPLYYLVPSLHQHSSSLDHFRLFIKFRRDYFTEGQAHLFHVRYLA